MCWRLGERGCSCVTLEDRAIESTCNSIRRARKLKETILGKDETGVPLMRGVVLVTGEVFRSACVWFFVRCQHPSP